MNLPGLPAELWPAAIVAAATALVAGLARGFSGFGAAMIFVPIASAALGPVVAMPILLLADVVTSSQLIRAAARACAWPDVKRVAVGGLIGLPIGNHLLTTSDPTLVRWAVVILIGLSLAVMVSGWRFRAAPGPATSAGVGVVSGLMSGLAQIGGPPVVMYWLSTETDTARVRANLSVYFAILMWTALAIFAVKGLLTPTVLWLAAAAAPGYAVGMLAGARLFGLASPQTFRRIAIGLVALAALLGVPALDPWLKWGG